jgi:zinc protease
LSASLTLPHIPIEQFTLENGLRVVLSEDHTIPVVSICVYYDVGSRNERDGRTGFAHLFEHMMFQGSENVPKAAHFQYIFNSGGTMNGTTSSERTNYYETLPANQLPLALWLESDRMRSLKVTQENLDNQRNAVQEEKRLNYDNRPYSNAFLRLNELIYQNPANAHSTIGSMQDLDDATIEDIREFFRIYYAPNNAVLVIVGDFDPAEARALVEKYFATIPRQPEPPGVDVSEPLEVAAPFETYPDPFAQLPALMLGWKAPARRTPDAYALTLASELLLEGESSRLYQKLVKGDESVVAVQGGIGERRGPSSLYLFAIPKPGRSTDEIRRTINEEIARLAAEGPSAEEMEKLRNTLLNDSVRGRQTTMYRAQRLAEYTLYDGDPHLVNTEVERYLAVTAEQIKDAVARYLHTDNHALIEIIPSPEGTEQAAPAATAPALKQEEVEQPGAPPPQVPPRPPTPEPAPPTETPETPITQT